jgi:uncharacterized membrane protein
MKDSRLFYRRLLFVCAAIFFTVAIVLILGVIQPVKIEVSRGATPEKAVTAFWVNIGLNFLSAVTLVFIAIKSKHRSWMSTSVLVIVGLLVLILSLALADAASAYQSHGPQMQSASLILFTCAAADFLAGALVFTTAFLRPKKV